MSFAADVKATPHLDGAFCKGLGALLAVDRARVTKAASTRLPGSVNVDAALRASQPDAARWDYVVGKRQGNREHLHWIEVHPAGSTGNINEVAAKLDWLAEWMRATPLAAYPKQIVWIASGKSAFNQRSPQLRALANRGLRYGGNHLSL
ncbi:hypothetical protein [Accumulibacter sp.]|uniref:hypothetical protein n=1 Tax=Accumulibacter sp. TaxID=2053492 RepID=UPI0025FD506E|nr:hypothetical protein [Accumulibacter sp.]MCM8614227.1 hypothetical protein [Accumulibacter sp.]MCM8638004.1 hypothetical protein [Accumulibacter sp.]MCM8641352.1 hypothetical protein [Accumulibacter sp.]